MNKIKIIALFGESGSGKDTILNIVSKHFDIYKIISCTTRPKRDYEENGKDYLFLTEEEFLEKDIICKKIFNDWYYGISLDLLDTNKINIGIFSIAAIKELLADERFEVLPIYVHASNKTRLLRSLNREKNPNCQEICRRFLADYEDFKISEIIFHFLLLNNDKSINLFSNIINYKDLGDWINHFDYYYNILSK